MAVIMDHVVRSIREVLVHNGNLSVDPRELAIGDNLFDLGMSSFQSVQLMMALEDRFDLQFPDDFIRKETFTSIQSMAEAVEFILGERLAMRRAV